MPSFLWGAAPKFDVDKIVQQYSNYNNVVLENYVDVLIDIVDDSLIVRSHTKESILLLNKDSKQGSSNSIYFSDFDIIKNIEAYSYVPNGKKYRKYKASEHMTTSNESGSVFYDDSKIIEILYPRVESGAIMTLEYDRHTKDAHFLNSFSFQSGIPIIESRLSVKVRKGVELKYNLFNTDSKKIIFSKEESGDYWVYEWLSKHNDATKDGNKYVGWMHILPHIRFYLGEVKFNDRKEYYFRNIEDLHHYYYNFINKLEVDLDEALVDEARAITEDASPETEKVKSVLYWVQNNIKYVAYEQGYRGFIPHDANYVFQKRYGDCKDMASIIVGMLRSLGIKGYYTWVGTRNIPYSYYNLPTNAVDNHMVAVYFEGSKPIILDGTMDMYQYRMTPHHLQGKELLISIDQDSVIIAGIPITPKNNSEVKDSIILNISDGGVLNGTAKKTFSGYYRYEMASVLDGKNKDAIEKSLERSLQKGNNKFQLESVSLSDYDNREEDIEIDYEFTIDDYVRILDNDMYVNMNVDKNMKNLKIDTTFSIYPIENDFKGVERCVTRFKIPQHYSISYLPEDFNYSNPKFSVELSYSRNDSTITQNKEIGLNFLLIEKEDFAAWDDMIIQLRRHYNKVVSLSKESKE